MSAKRKAAPEATTLRVVKQAKTAPRGVVTHQNFRFHASISCAIRVEEKKTGTVMDYHIYIDEPQVDCDELKAKLGEIGKELGFSEDLTQGMQNVIEKHKQEQLARRGK